MVRYFVKLGVLIFVFITVGVGAATMAGKALPTRVILAAALKPSTIIAADNYRSNHFLTFIDFNRFVSLRIHPPISDIENLQLIPHGDDYLVLASTIRYEQRVAYQGMYLYNIKTGDVKTLMEFEGQPGRITSIYLSNMSWSNDFTKFAYVDSHLQELLVLDTITGTLTPLVDLSTIRYSNIAQIRWSPDNQQIAYSYDTMLHVMNADGTNPRQFTQGSAAFSYFWTPDNQSIFMQSYPNSNRAMLKMIDAQTGEAHPVVNDLRGNHINTSWHFPGYPCWREDDHGWIAYQRYEEGNESSMVVLHIDTGEEINLSTNPAFNDEFLNTVMWGRDCQTLFITTGSGSIYSSVPKNNRIYTADLRGENVQFLAEGGLMLDLTGEDEIYYQKVIQHESPTNTVLGTATFQVYRKDLTGRVPDALVGVHTLKQPFFLWTDDGYEKAIYLDGPLTSSIRQMLYVDIAGGEHFPLTAAEHSVLGFSVFDW